MNVNYQNKLNKLNDLVNGVKAGVNQALKMAEKAFDDKVLKAQSTVTVVYDGKAPYIAAHNIYEYIKAMGHRVMLIDADKYKEGGWEIGLGKVIIVGHHKLTKAKLEMTVTVYDSYGMKFGYSMNLCVLRASRSALGRGAKGRKRFAEYYNNRIYFHEELANLYGTPLLFGMRDETRKSQYDLLWLEFVTYGLPKYLDIPKIKDPEAEDSKDIAEKAASDLIRQLDADKDMTFSLEDIMKRRNEQFESEGIKTLRAHLGNDIAITGVWGDAQNKCQLEDGELLEGEVSAVTFTIGCYTIRSAERLYKDADSERFPEGIKPAGREETAAYMEREDKIGAALVRYDDDKHFHLTHEISAKHNTAGGDAFSNGYQYICRAEISFSWSEEIQFICTLKSDASLPDDRAALWVLKEYMGSSFSVENWYKLAPDGRITTYRVHPYDEDSFQKSWKDTEDII